jgi:hypothetical protein
MAFKIEKRDSYRWTVDYVLSMKDGRPHEVMKLDVEFKALSAKEAGAAVELARTQPMEAFERILVGWHDAPEGWDFSMKKLEELFEFYPGISGAFLLAYMESIWGQTAAGKN